MLQKFLRRSFRRTSKDYKQDEQHPRNLLERSQSLPSEQMDIDVIKSPSITSERDMVCRKVTFKESLESPEKSCTDEKGETGLFDDSVLEAFQVGNLSIAEFLQSPHTSPKISKASPIRTNSAGTQKQDSVDVTPKRECTNDSVKCVSKSGTPKRNNPGTGIPKIDNATSFPKPDNSPSIETRAKITASPISSESSSWPRKKLSLLDKAHSVKKKALDSPSDDVIRSETTSTPQLTDSPDLRKVDKARFSKSLETLAHQVFGEDYQTYLNSASKSPVKFSIVSAKQESLDSCGSVATHCSSFDSKSSDQVFSSSDYLRVQRKTPPAKKERQKLKKMPHSLSIHNDNRVPITEQRFVRSFDKAAAQELQQPQSMESWHNELDLRPKSLAESPCDKFGSTGSEVLGAINENEVVASVDETQNRKRAKSLGALKDVYASKTITSPVRRRIPKTDSQIVQIGSFSENELSASESSFINIQFPPPPPTNDGCDFTDPNFDAASFSSYELDDSNDPLISSLMSIVPLPNDPEKLVSVLSNALSEIVTEIVASRRKLNSVIKAIHIHQQILKEQCRQIKNHHKEINELRRTAYALNNYQTIYRYDRNSKSNSARSSRQSREMVELNYTLDKLLQQCSNMQRQSNYTDVEDDVNITEAEQDDNDDGEADVIEANDEDKTENNS